MTGNGWKNKLYYGDNLDWLRNHDRFPNESVDLIYLDPPFNSNADYNVIFNEPGGEQSQAQIRAFDDTWSWGRQASQRALEDLGNSNPELIQLIEWIADRGKDSRSLAAYLSMMAVRLVELHRVLKPIGSLYLHCDPNASHYLKVLLDAIFGSGNFRNEIIWKRTSAHSGSKRWGPVHDVILFYTKGNDFVWNTVFLDYSDDYVESFYRYSDEKGRFRVGDLTGPGMRRGASGQPWRGINPTDVGRHWAVPNKVLMELLGSECLRWTVQQKLDALDKAGLIRWPAKGNVPGFKRYFNEKAGVAIVDVVTDINPLSAQSAEKLGYPTQKPEALLERIITASSQEGQLVLDPFCGCGTTVAVAQNLKRSWIGIDVTWLAINKVEQRLSSRFGERIKDLYEVYGKPFDRASAQALALKDKKEFELWALSLVNAGQRQRDGGVDGLLSVAEGPRKHTKIIVQVKGGVSLYPGMVRDLMGTVEKEKAAMGLLITLEEPTAGMKELAIHAGSYNSPIWGKSYQRIQIRTVAELLEGKRFDIPYGESPAKKATPVKEKAKTRRMI